MIETERLILRKYNEKDFEDYWEYVSQENVGPMCGWEKYTEKQKAAERLMIESRKDHQFAIVLKSENKVIGSVELMDFKPERIEGLILSPKAKEIGFLLSEKYWGKGIMPEAVEAVVKFAFGELKVPEIFICHAEANKASGRVQDKLGFKIIGRSKNYRKWLDGENTDLIQRKMTAQEWRENHKEKQKSFDSQ